MKKPPDAGVSVQSNPNLHLHLPLDLSSSLKVIPQRTNGGATRKGGGDSGGERA